MKSVWAAYYSFAHLLQITEQPASYDRFIPQAGQNQLGIDLDTIQKGE